MSGRVRKSIINAEINLLFYFLTLFLAFFSRKIFLDCLSAEFIGLTGTLRNILGYLNLSEFGISACIGYFLFKPLQSNNKNEINEIISLLGYLYKWIGIIILCGALIISMFFPLIFSNKDLPLSIIYFAFYTLLGSSLIGYFINYRQILLSADQKNYLVAIYYQSANILKTIIQIYLAYNFKNYFIWVAIEFVFSVIGCIILNWKIDKEYPWLKVDRSQGKKLLEKYPDIIIKTKQVFIHKIKDFVLVKSDELFIFLFVSLKMVAYYGNYMMIISRLISLFSSITSSVGASIGNLVAEGNKEQMLKVFWELTTIQHTIAAIISFSIYCFIEPFINHWLGAEFILNHDILILLTVYLYICNSRGGVDTFNYAHGLYADVWSAWAELIINVSITIICGIKWGIIGILLGKIASLIPIVVIWKPYYLFTNGFKISVVIYWKNVLRNYMISAFSFGTALYTIQFIPLNPYNNIWEWIYYAISCMSIFLSIELTTTIIFCKGANDSIRRINKFIFRR